MVAAGAQRKQRGGNCAHACMAGRAIVQRMVVGLQQKGWHWEAP